MNRCSLLSLIVLTSAFLSIKFDAGAKLVAWYPLDESPADPATTVAEIADDNHAATIGLDLDPGVSLITRGHPSARQSLGSSYLLTKGGGFNLGGSQAVQPTDQFTISFWVQPLTLDPFDRILESQVGNSNGQDGLRIDTGAGNKIRALVRDANGATNALFSHPLSIRNDGTWYFIAFRYDSANIDTPFRLTVVEASAAAVEEGAITAATAGLTAITTGAMHYPHSAPGTLIGLENPAATGANNLHAALDEFAFYDNSDGNGVLSDAALADVYNFGPSAIQLINSFSTDVGSVSPGNPATLAWDVAEPFDSLILDDGAGNSTDLAPLTAAGVGTLEVTPAVTTTYSLRATRGAAANVSKLKLLAGAAPEITSFVSSAPIIQLGNSVNLSWLVTGADTLVLDPGGTDVSALAMTMLSPLETTTFTLSATNPFGTSTAEVRVVVTPGPVPTHRYDASSLTNSDTTWVDEVDTRNWALTGATRQAPLTIPSANTRIVAAYGTSGGINGGSVASFQYADFTAEIWLRPSEFLGADHELLFETGGGQNGVGALITATDFRFIGSAANARTLDLTVPLDGLNLDDFVQLVFSTSASSDAFEVAVRDTFGNVRTASATADITIGVNGAGIFVWASGILGGDNNLGGRTELADASPAGLTGFTGEIGLIHIYDRILDASEVQAAFDAVASTVDPPVETPFAITAIDHDPGNQSVVLTWNSAPGILYDAQFSTDMKQWFNFEDTVAATAASTTKTFNLPPNRTRFFLRIVDLGLD